ncbi:DEAD/DEAH box helicase [Bacillus cereus]|uniref:DEAD/DEAH box helicase n=1 Tax=Bacillus cereus TaxID=1396 RepID=UPI000BEDD8BE|nr:DEAD/DEAH box helicase [Bacillus cereus]PDZ79355.1 helicase [Bacillus cereus]PEW28462.1 helicase [Bacillus cereus]PGR20119.1 helicase [Bacillus cereus]
MEKLTKKLINGNSLDLEESFQLAKECSSLLYNLETEHLAHKLIINILDNWSKIHTSTKDIWIDLVESAGFYPYLEKLKQQTSINGTAAKIRKEYHKSPQLINKYLHEEQKILLNLLMQGKNLVVSAPTSFGKSLLIEELISSKKYTNIVIIQPTLALLEETRLKLKNYSNYYKIIIRTSQKPSKEKGNLFLLTAERVMEYTNLPKIDFLILDEFYKLSTKRDDERSDTLNNAFNLLVNKHNARFYLLGPNIDNISPGFAEKYNAEFYKTKYSLVDNQIIDVYSQYKNQFGTRGHKKEFKEKVLFDLLYELEGEQTIIYCSSPSRVRNLSIKFLKYLINREIIENNSSREIPLIDWIGNYINKNWQLINCLKYGIGIHDGALQKHISTSIIKYFNDEKLRYLFCTSTIIEGVNTSAKNVIYFDSKKGGKPIDFFDYSNICGRSGRMMIHYVGKVYNFNPKPEIENIQVDIPFFEQKPISDEVLIHIEDENVRFPDSQQYKDLQNIPQEERELFKKNGLSVKGQQIILEQLKKDLTKNFHLIKWNYPNYDQLQYILHLAWDNLIKKGETTSPMTKKKLVKLTHDYGKEKNILFLINSNYKYMKSKEKNKTKDDLTILDDAIRETFQILKHWFQYKVPKWLNVVNNLQTYVCQKYGFEPGNYSPYASQLENEFIRENLSILIEFGIPSSAIKKLAQSIPSELNEDLVLQYITNKNLMNNPKLLDYEKEKIRENL